MTTRTMSLTTNECQGVRLGDPYWTYDDDGSPVPDCATPEALDMVRKHSWHVCQNRYPNDEFGYPHCGCCGALVTIDNFNDDPHAVVTKDYCAACAAKEAIK